MERFFPFFFFFPATNLFCLNLSTFFPQVPQISRRQAEQVLSSCASQLKKYLTEAVKSSSVPLDKHSDVVDSICEGAFDALKQEEVVANEKEVSSLTCNSVLYQTTFIVCR